MNKENTMYGFSGNYEKMSATEFITVYGGTQGMIDFLLIKLDSLFYEYDSYVNVGNAKREAYHEELFKEIEHAFSVFISKMNYQDESKLMRDYIFYGEKIKSTLVDLRLNTYTLPGMYNILELKQFLYGIKIIFIIATFPPLFAADLVKHHQSKVSWKFRV